MSWMKRPQGGAVPPPGPERQPYAAPQAQPYGNQQNMYPNYQAGGTGGTAPPPQGQYWGPQQQQVPQYTQQYPAYPQDNASTPQYYQEPNQFNQNYTNQGFNNSQQTYPQNYYPNQGASQPHPNYPPQQPQDGWEDNWDWGWDEASKQSKAPPNTGHLHATQHPPQQIPQQAPQAPQQVFNNANIIEESFAPSDCWNWAMDDKKDNQQQQTLPPSGEHNNTGNIIDANPLVENNTRPEVSAPRSNSNASAQHSEEVRTLNDKEVVKERLPNLALGKRFHLDNLTPQWSIESQMSQESSDGPLTHSEGTYTSENQSRNSSKGSPGPNTDNSNFNYSQSALDDGYSLNSEWSRPSEHTLTESINSNSRRESHDELAGSMQDMRLSGEAAPADRAPHEPPARNTADSVPAALPPPAHFPPPVSLGVAPTAGPAMPPPPPVAAPPASSPAPTIQPPPSSSSLPPPNFPPPTSSHNPFKSAAPFSHKSLAKGSTGSSSSLQAFPPQPPGANLTSPAAVSKVAQHNRVPVGGFEANLETTPDNSERPDQPQLSPFRPLAVSQQVPDNLEVAPRNDRNEYLQTAHLSSSDYGENTDFSRGAPPPGLRRMVVGQHESEYGQNLNISGDEPPPGLARMVPGQQTETENGYSPTSDNYLERHIDGQTTEAGARPYRQAEGEYRPVGLARMVPGEPSNDEYVQYAAPAYPANNEQRVVTGLDREFSMPVEAGPPDVREQNVDGSDYSERNPRNAPRNIIGGTESSNEPSPDFGATPEDGQREVTMEGENLQDLSVISSADLNHSREQIVDGADAGAPDAADRKTDLSDSVDPRASSSRRHSSNRVITSGEESERDRAFKSSPRRDRGKTSRDRHRGGERERDKEGRYSRDDRKYSPEPRARDERHGDKYRERDDSDDAPRTRRNARSRRYDTEDTDYYSDRERDRRRHREGSYTSTKPPRGDKERRHDERGRRYNTIERERRHERDDERRRDRDRHRSERTDRTERADRSERADRTDRGERYERAYRDIDPSRKYGNLRRHKDKDELRRGEYSPAPPATDEEADPRRRHDRRARRTAEPFYDEYGGYSQSSLAQRQYSYYEQLRRADPAAYLALYQRLLAGHAPPAHFRPAYPDDYSALSYETRQERGSVHSGRSSAAGLKGNDTYYVYSRRAPPSPRTDLSDRDMTTDMSITLPAEDSTARSERMTPFRYSTAHIKGSVASRDVVVVRAAWPVDGAPATVHVLALRHALQHRADVQELGAFPGPLVRGVTHKKSVIDYCSARARDAARDVTRDAPRDVTGYVLVWHLLALMLRLNGVVAGTDIAELLMKNTREYEFQPPTKPPPLSGRASALSSEDERAADGELTDTEGAAVPSVPARCSEQEALARLRELLTYGNRQEAIEWAMSNNLWSHALWLSVGAERRLRTSVAARWVLAQARADPLHSLYAAHAHLPHSVPDESTDWRPHVAVLLANPTTRRDADTRTLTLIGDTLQSRGLIYSAQFCYLSAGVELSAHPLSPLPPAHPAPPAPAPPAPARLSLLLAAPRCASLAQLAHARAVCATEVLEYARTLAQEDYVLPELQPYKLLVVVRLLDAGLYERALAYTERLARALTRAPGLYSPALIMRVAELADRLKYHDPALQEEPPLQEAHSAEASPRHAPAPPHAWLDQVQALAQQAQSAHSSPQHVAQHYEQQQHQQYQQHQQHELQHEQHQQHDQPPQYYSTEHQSQQQYQQLPVQSYEAAPEESPDYAQYYQQQAGEPLVPQAPPQPAPPEEPPQYSYEDWPRGDEAPAPSYADPYWGDNGYAGYGEGGSITMPGARREPARDADDDRPPSASQTAEQDADSPKRKSKPDSKSPEEGRDNKKGGWLGGILTKLSLRPPNQMILPDDKNPAIVWDADSKRWRHRDGDAQESEQPPPPPPRLPDPPRQDNNMAPVPGSMPAPPVANIFKMQKGRHIKKSYVDVFNPSGAPTRALPPAADVLGPPAPLAAPTNYFVPAPMPQPSTEVPSRSLCSPPPPPARSHSTSVSMPPSPCPSSASSTPSSLPPLPPLRESGVFDPSMASESESYERSGI